MVRIKSLCFLLRCKPESTERTDGAKESSRWVAWDKGFRRPRTDARVLPLAADVASARARSRDAAIPSVAAPSRPHRAAVAHPARVGVDRRHRSHGARAHRLSAWPEPLPHFA